MKKYTVAEFAEILGITKQAVYKRIKTEKIKPFVSYVDGKTYIEETAISIVKQVEQLEVKNGEQTKAENAGNKAEKEVKQPVEKVEITGLTALIDQLEKKDQQIEFLQQQIRDLQQTMKEKDNYILEQGKQLSKLLEQSNTLKYLESVDQSQDQQQTNEDPGVAVETPQKKKGFFSRFFGKASDNI